MSKKHEDKHTPPKHTTKVLLPKYCRGMQSFGEQVIACLGDVETQLDLLEALAKDELFDYESLKAIRLCIRHEIKEIHPGEHEHNMVPLNLGDNQKRVFKRMRAFEVVLNKIIHDLKKK